MYSKRIHNSHKKDVGFLPQRLKRDQRAIDQPRRVNRNSPSYKIQSDRQIISSGLSKIRLTYS